MSPSIADLLRARPPAALDLGDCAALVRYLRAATDEGDAEHRAATVNAYLHDGRTAEEAARIASLLDEVEAIGDDELLRRYPAADYPAWQPPNGSPAAEGSRETAAPASSPPVVPSTSTGSRYLPWMRSSVEEHEAEQSKLRDEATGSPLFRHRSPAVEDKAEKSIAVSIARRAAAAKAKADRKGGGK